MQDGIVIPETGPEAPLAPTNDRPAWLPDNFKTPEDLANSYKAAQAELTRIKQGIAPESDPGTPPVTPAEDKATPPADKPKDDLTIDKAAADAVANAGLNFDKLADEFSAEGKLGDESYKALEKQGIPKAVVDEFIRMKQGEAAAVRNEVVGIAGGEESFQQMVQWASANYPDVEVYNKMISSGDPASMRMAMVALKSAYVSANGSDPKLQMGTGAASTGSVYASDLEMVADMQKPEYRSDPAFRRQVEEKVSRSMARR
jgi:hypothetical protein